MCFLSTISQLNSFILWYLKNGRSWTLRTSVANIRGLWSWPKQNGKISVKKSSVALHSRKSVIFCTEYTRPKQKMIPCSLNSNRNLNQQKIQVSKVCVYRVVNRHSNETKPETSHTVLSIFCKILFFSELFLLKWTFLPVSCSRLKGNVSLWINSWSVLISRHRFHFFYRRRLSSTFSVWWATSDRQTSTETCTEYQLYPPS